MYKKFFVIVFISVFLFGCKDSPQQKIPEKNIEDIGITDLSENLLVEFQAIDSAISEKHKDAYSTADMAFMMHEKTEEYDKLMQKKYDELLLKIEKEDQEILKQAQEDWVIFRESESKLNSLLSEAEYSSGTIQRLYNLSNYLRLIKERTLHIYDHYERIY